MSANEIAKIVFDAYKAVLEVLGPGLLEKAYQTALVYELKQRGLSVEKEVEMPIMYKEVTIDQAYSQLRASTRTGRTLTPQSCKAPSPCESI